MCKIMSASGIFYALITVLAWCTWLTPYQNAHRKGRQTRRFFVTQVVMLIVLTMPV